MPGVEEDPLLGCMTWAIFLLAVATFVSTNLISAAYGKHSRPGWGPLLPSPLAWSLMESPTLLLPAVLLLVYKYPLPPFSVLPLALFLLHYLNRTLLYPLRLLLLPSPPSPVPLSIVLLAFAFNVFNAFLQTRSLSLAPPPEDGTARVNAGVLIFLWGMSVNLRSDAALLRLRAEGAGYQMPRGGWFDLVCCPNYMGEAAEWLGWAVVAWTPAALGFFVYTCSNLVPRARGSLRWYRRKFGDEFPASTKAIVPFLY